MKRKIYMIIGFCLALAVFIYLMVRVITKGGNPLGIDEVVRDWCYDIRGEKGGFIYWLFRIITEFGYLWVVLAIGTAILILTKFNNKFVCIVFGVVLCYVATFAIKDIISRPRPSQKLWWMNETYSSFPSGHSSNAAVMYGFIIYLIRETKLKSWLKNLLIGCGVAIILLVAFSRMIMGVHYFSDVLAGIAFGSLFSFLTIIVYEFMKRRNILNDNLVNIFKNRNKNNEENTNNN